MDEKGFISVEYLFSLFIILIITCGLLFYASSTISSSLNIENSVSHRLILDNVASVINQVNSNGIGYSKYIKLPSDRGYFEMTVDKSKLTIEYDGKKGETMLPLINIDSKYKMVSGRGYYISKTEDGKIVIT
ncbi:hypothetical protein [Methanobrevibacter sp. YE315]|uniref:hypothetical protein n=1 Tax=Methanobrevibacter sp. YE315 TaxID=1609968 RepID=UPI0009E887E7|nr:hypothetical protein [Methanobrevibacter sp. YE315]